MMIRNRSAAAVALVVAAVLLSACGGSSGGTSTGAPASTPAASGAPGAGNGQPSFPGASGLVAALDGTTMQVQSPRTGQVAVSWTGSTTFTTTVAGSANDVRVGRCVTVRSGSAGTATDAVTAATVSVSTPVDGTCTGGGLFGGGPGGTRPSGATGSRPSGQQGGARPSGAPGAGRPVSGQVTAVAGSTLTVAAVRLGPATSSSASPSTSPVTVATTGATTWTKTVEGSANDLTVGQCVTALGKVDDTGAVTAASISSRPATDGQCDLGGQPGAARGNG
jgi:hypothetical protein